MVESNNPVNVFEVPFAAVLSTIEYADASMLCSMINPVSLSLLSLHVNDAEVRENEVLVKFDGGINNARQTVLDAVLV